MIITDVKTNLSYELEEEIADIVNERFTAPAPTNFEELMDKFVFNKEIVNEDVLKTIFSNFSYKGMKNVNKIYILSIEDLSDYEQELIDCDIDYMLFKGLLGIHNTTSGNVVICLEHHISDNLDGKLEYSLEVILTTLHEVGHAVQLSEEHPFFFEAVDWIRQSEDYIPLKENSSDGLESDAEGYAHKHMKMIEFNLRIDDNFFILENLINWDKIEY